MAANPLLDPDNLQALSDIERIKELCTDRNIAIARALTVVLILALPLLPVARMTSSLGIVTMLLFITTIAMAGVRNLGSEWVQAVLEPKRLDQTGGVIAAIHDFGADRRVMGIVVSCSLAFLASCGESVIKGFYQYGGLSGIVANAFIVSSLFPASALAGLFLARKIKVISGDALRLPAKIGRHFAISTKSFFVKRYPYLSAYGGFACFCVIVSLAPRGLGAGIAGWLQACLNDANIGHGPVSPQFQLVVSLCLGLSLFGAMHGIAVRLSAGFQALSVRLLLHRENIVDALIETTNVRSTKIPLQQAHPHLDNIKDSMLWLATCYSVLFFLVAFCPGPLGTAILSWLQSSVVDAGFDANMFANENLRLFVASIVAGYGSVPVAIMTSAFLPFKKAQCLIISSQGVLSPQSASPTQAPLKHWSDLRRVSLSNAGKRNETVKLNFKSYGTIKLKTKDMDKQKLAELLAIADEYAPQCKFDSQSIVLRTKLTQESRAGSLADQTKFAATIFSTKRSGEFLQEGKYRVVRKISGKPLAAVYLARDLADKHVVVKEFVLPTCVQESQKLDESFEREFKALSTLRHHSIANVIETFEEDQAKYIVIEHIDGSDLRTVVQRRGRRDEKTVLRWAKEVAELMQYLHGQSTPVLHRDLTPDNLMEDSDGNIKLIDFGAAHQFMEGVTGTLIGKQCYIAPEQLRGKPSTQSDIYSFGCTIYFLLTGFDPKALDQCDLESAGVRVSPWLCELVKRCTDFDETQRYQSFEEIAAALSQKPTPSSNNVLSLPSTISLALSKAELEKR